MKDVTEKEFLEQKSEEKFKTLQEIAKGETKIKQESIMEERVRELLENIPETRKSDELLYTMYIEQYYNIEFNKHTFVNYQQYQLPSFKSIERTRRDIQVKNKSLVDKNKQEVRTEIEEKYKDYYINENHIPSLF